MRRFKWLKRILWGGLIAALYYFVFSVFFDTPIEHEIKRGTAQLDARYEELVAKRDSLKLIIENIQKRDSSVFEIIFEAKPYEDTLARRGLTISDLDRLSNAELGEIFDDRMAQLQAGVSNYHSDILSIIAHIDSSLTEVNYIPSIQPVNNPELTLLACSYGERIHPFYKARHFHYGVDYAVPTGTAVFATADGVVQNINIRGQSTGTSITLSHGKDYKTFYGYLDKVLVRAGSRVMRGDVIGFSGNTGLSYAPHLHYEVIFKGEKVDPLPYFFGELGAEETLRMKSIASVAMQSFD